MQDTIDQILDLTSNLFREKYGFIEVYPTICLFKSSQKYGGFYRGLQIYVTGSYKYKTHDVSIGLVPILTFADQTYDEVMDKALNEMSDPQEETLKSIETLIINPSKRKADKELLGV